MPVEVLISEIKEFLQIWHKFRFMTDYLLDLGVKGFRDLIWVCMSWVFGNNYLWIWLSYLSIMKIIVAAFIMSVKSHDETFSAAYTILCGSNHLKFHFPARCRVNSQMFVILGVKEWQFLPLSVLSGPRNDAESAKKFILQMYKECHSGHGKRLYPHFTCATDTENIRIVFKAVKDTLFSDILSGYNLE